MKKYRIEYNYIASIIVEVEGNYQDEGQALEAGRILAQNADIADFSIGEEQESRILGC